MSAADVVFVLPPPFLSIALDLTKRHQGQTQRIDTFLKLGYCPLSICSIFRIIQTS